jgi:hypothetical protein
MLYVSRPAATATLQVAHCCAAAQTDVHFNSRKLKIGDIMYHRRLAFTDMMQLAWQAVVLTS